MIRDKLLRTLILFTDFNSGVAPLGVKLSAVDFALLRSTFVDGEGHVILLYGVPVIPDHGITDGTVCLCLRGDVYDYRPY